MKPSLVMILFLMIGCSTYSEKDCANFNWNEQGAKLAKAGKTKEETLSYYEQKCFREHEVRPIEDELSRGHDLGLKELCTKLGGYKLGSKGLSYKNTCSGLNNLKSENAFLLSYISGYNNFLSNRIEDLSKKNLELEREVSTLKAIIRGLERDKRILWDENRARIPRP